MSLPGQSSRDLKLSEDRFQLLVVEQGVKPWTQLLASLHYRLTAPRFFDANNKALGVFGAHHSTSSPSLIERRQQKLKPVAVILPIASANIAPYRTPRKLYE